MASQRAALLLNWAFVIVATLTLAACGGGGSNNTSLPAQQPRTTSSTNAYSVSVKVTGLNGTLKLANGNDNLSVTNDGTYTISKSVPKGTAYTVSVATQPSTETCGVTNGSGAVTTQNVSNIFVNCSELAGNAKILSNKDIASTLSNTAANSLTFSSLPTNLAGLKAGDIIYSGATNTTPSGLLRKVVSIAYSNGQTIVTTTPAKLTDLIANGGFNNTINLSDALAAAHPNGMRITPYATLLAVSSAADYCGSKKSGFVLKFSNQPISPLGSVSGCVGLTLSLNTSGTISLGGIKTFQFLVTGSVSQAISLTVSDSEEKKASYSWPLGKIPAPIPIGPFVIPATLDLNVVLHANAKSSGSIMVGAGVVSTISDGARYANGKLTLVHDSNPSHNLIGPTVSASASLSAAIGPQIGYKIFDAAGPEITFDTPYVNFNADLNANPWWEADAGISGELDLSLDANQFGLPVKLDYNAGKLFDINWVLGKANGPYGGSNSAPTASFSFAPSTPLMGKQVTFTNLSSDSDGDSLTWTWDFGDGSTSSDENPKHTFQNAGNYNVSLTVTDSVGLSNTKTENIDVSSAPVNQPPVANAGPDQTVTTGSTVMLDGSGSSDSNNKPLIYSWSFLSKPTGSNAVLDDPSAAQPTFIADKDGMYKLQLTVSDGSADSLPDTVLVTASTSQSKEVSVSVPGTSDPWLAGMPDGSTASEGDIAPNESPVYVSGITVIPGEIITFTASGAVAHGPDFPELAPDGGTVISHTAGAQNGISNISAPVESLIGVFLSGSSPDQSSTTKGLDFGSYGLNFTKLSPNLKQVFFIGDGTNSSGTKQEFIVPQGASRLYLGTMDGGGWYNNKGSFNVDVKIN